MHHWMHYPLQEPQILGEQGNTRRIMSPLL